jgi:hypothetical protein
MSTPHQWPLNWSNAKVKGNAVVAFHPHSDYLFREASTRETNEAGYLMRMCEGTPQSETGCQSEKWGIYVSEFGH